MSDAAGPAEVGSRRVQVCLLVMNKTYLKNCSRRVRHYKLVPPVEHGPGYSSASVPFLHALGRKLIVVVVFHTYELYQLFGLASTSRIHK